MLGILWVSVYHPIYIPLKAHRDLSILKMLHISPPQAPRNPHLVAASWASHPVGRDSDGISMGHQWSFSGHGMIITMI